MLTVYQNARGRAAGICQARSGERPIDLGVKDGTFQSTFGDGRFLLLGRSFVPRDWLFSPPATAVTLSEV